MQIQLRALQRGKAHHGSYPDLVRLHREEEGESQQLSSVKRSASLQDLDKLVDFDSDGRKKLKPILRKKGAGVRSRWEWNEGQPQKLNFGEKGSVKFGRKEVKLIRDDPLPPIEGRGLSSLSQSIPASKGKADLSSEGGAEVKGQVGKSHPHNGAEPVGLSPVHELNVHSGHGNQRRVAQDRSPDIFPRGLPVEVRKPATPRYDDYPEVFQVCVCVCVLPNDKSNTVNIKINENHLFH